MTKSENEFKPLTAMTKDELYESHIKHLKRQIAEQKRNGGLAVIAFAIIIAALILYNSQ